MRGSCEAHEEKRNRSATTASSKSWLLIWIFLHEPYISLSMPDEKGTFFMIFECFLSIFDHENACLRMRSLVEINNTPCFKFK